MHRVKKHIGTHHITSSKRLVLIALVIVLGVVGYLAGFRNYMELFRTDISLEKDSNLSLTESLTLDFSQPVFSEKYVSKITISEADDESARKDAEYVWSSGDKKLTIRPSSYWKPEKEYFLEMPAGRNAFWGPINPRMFRFSTVPFPKVKDVIPTNGSADVIMDIEEPITVKFDSSIKDFFIKIELSPASEAAYDINDERTELKFIPKTKMLDGTLYELRILARAAYEPDLPENYREISRSSFSTRKMKSAENQKSDLGARLEDARQSTVPKVLTGKYIDVNLNSQVMTLFEDGNLLDAYLVSSGKRGMETPLGNHKIANKAPRPYSKEYGLYMPYWMAIVPGGKVGIHELPEWPGGYKEGANHLGIPVSHGCIRLGVGSAGRVYEWAEIGTPVIVY